MKQIYRVAICYNSNDCNHMSNDAYFDSEDPELISKIKNHLINGMSYRGSFDNFESITKENIESVICNLDRDYDIELLTLK